MEENTGFPPSAEAENLTWAWAMLQGQGGKELCGAGRAGEAGEVSRKKAGQKW